MDTDKLNKRLESLRNSNSDGKVKEIYNILYQEELWYIAYQNIYSNKGAFTKSVDEDTLDKLDKSRILNIILSLKEKTYKPKPSKRIYITKSNGELRPLNIPCGTDKLVQECMKIILDSIYDPKFSNTSHGFRPKKSCHTALAEMSMWSGIKWFIEFDIKGCFDNINHSILINILEKKINDKKFINLLKLMIKAGYIDDWKYNSTYSGTPQGGIISPILANIYLNELDEFVDKLSSQIILTSSTKRNRNKEYEDLTNLIRRRRKRKIDLEQILSELETTKNQYLKINNKFINELLTECIKINDKIQTITYTRKNPGQYNNLQRKRKRRLQSLEYLTKIDEYELLKLSRYYILQDEYVKINEDYLNAKKNREKIHSVDFMDESVKRLKYCRYADDFVIGYVGSISDAYDIKEKIITYLKDHLKLEINEIKSNIISSKKGINFLGYDINYRRTKNDQFKYKTRNDVIYKTRRYSNLPLFKVPSEKAIQFCKKKKYGSYVDNISIKNAGLLNFDVIEIVDQYNSELRGVANYYKYAIDMKRIIGKIQWLNHYSLAKTLAAKYQCSVAQLFKKNIINVRNGFWYVKQDGIERRIFKIKEIERINFRDSVNLMVNDNNAHFTIKIRNSAVKKLISNTCEICGSSKNDIKIHLHHKNPVRKITNDDWLTKTNKLRNRKTLALCEQCHIKITVNSNNQLRRNK